MKKSEQAKRLTLTKTTIQELTSNELQGVEGGWHLPTISCQKPCGSTSAFRCSCATGSDAC